MYEILLLIIICVIFLLIFNKLHKKRLLTCAGKQGEDITYNIIKNNLRKNKGVVYRNLKIPLYNNTTEIDFLVISDNGVLCIENKHVSGKIIGETNDKYWKQIKSDRSTKKMYNPIMQNEGHIKCLRYHFSKNNIDFIPIYSYIVFSNTNVKINFKQGNMGNIKLFEKYLKKYFLREKNKFKINDIKNVIDKIKIS